MDLLDDEDGGSFIGELTSSIPGIDEAMSFAEVMKMVQTMDYSCVVFDTAPTGEELKPESLMEDYDCDNSKCSPSNCIPDHQKNTQGHERYREPVETSSGKWFEAVSGVNSYIVMTA